MRTEITLRDIINTLKRRFYILIIVFILVFWGVMYIYNILPKSYESYMEIELNLNQNNSSSQIESLFNLGGSNTELKAEIEKMKTDEILRNIVRDFNLVESKNKSRHIIDRLRGKIYYERDLIEILKDQLKIEPVEGTNILKISIQKSSPDYAKRFIDSWFKYYKLYRENYQKKVNAEKLEYLNPILKKVENDLDEISKKVLDFELKNKITENNPLMDKYYEIVKELYQYEEEKNTLDIKVKNFENVYLNIDPQMKEIYLTEKNQQIKNIKLELENTQYEYETVKILSPNSPKAIELKTKIDVLKAQLEKKLNVIINNKDIYLSSISPDLLSQYKELKYSYEVLDTRYQMLKNLEKDLSKKIIDQSPVMYEYLKLKKEQKILEEKYEIIKNTIEQITINNLLNTEKIKIINASFTPTRAIFPSFKMFFVGGFLFAFFIGSIVALRFELKDNKIHSLKDFEYNFKSPEVVINSQKDIHDISKYIYGLNKNNILILNTITKKDILEKIENMLNEELKILDYNFISISNLDISKIKELEKKINSENNIVFLKEFDKNDLAILSNKIDFVITIVSEKYSVIKNTDIAENSIIFFKKGILK
ncbi:uncharacterized protein involved in exopolysaccharide biosynthesis [Marinitoga piezophila KA3]|uniref:Uncharacterized protein involved in exopolysaccharide biosynthesis n=1 Tax=Marinitoga piezophila (strain DSM 14283 / JCM 11233 / KA3) TaxID=443254 RepID=H2J2V9_MARPK|nr:MULTISPECIES: Wzz/FepE/Etk N-terminal domain-containing protein [Marinitoga]AEX85650.1 uncharacterized protein involved in exopolysaccharide biosynthesis [Marinitoga piezophila KA3]APT76103.1 hypothetical protein LN42_06700 [Marinitoga sp. 1137]